MTIGIFLKHQDQFKANNPSPRGDDDNQVFRRCSYTREQKLAAIDYALNTWERAPGGDLVYISRYYACKQLYIVPSLLTRWIKSKHRILYLRRGKQRLRLSKVGRHPELKKKLNREFESARSIRRQITHRWFLRYVSPSLENSS
jgi:hypothetical protein